MRSLVLAFNPYDFVPRIFFLLPFFFVCYFLPSTSLTSSASSAAAVAVAVGTLADAAVLLSRAIFPRLLSQKSGT